MTTRPPRPDIHSRWRRAFLLILAGASLLAGCTTQAWYEGSRASARQQCNQQPPGAYEDCMRRVNEGVGGKSYDSYEREREELRRK
ncbi:hypothetical protein ACLBKS_15580 [Hylemonella sp. W303a]|uniref:hypothetical protein n=1 Tax=Hylemonella sp. W303a TaxID=3389873 RepID=UPI00396B44C8